MKGRYFLRERSGGVDKALGYFQEAAEIDPTYAAAYESIARCYMRIASYGSLPSSLTVPKAREAIEKTISLDPQSAEAHLLLAEINLVHDWDWKGARIEFDKAVEFGLPTPNIFDAFYQAAIFNNLDLAIRIATQVQQNDPLDFSDLVDLANFHSWYGQYNEAREIANRILELDSSFGEAYAIRAETFMFEKNNEEAIRNYKRAAELTESWEWVEQFMIPFIENFENFEFITDMFGQLENLASSGQVPTMIMINSYGFTGRNDDAFRWLERGIEEKDYFMYRVQINPFLRPLHADPRWQEMLDKIGFPKE
jgi:serine/threonine-protein kinase